MWFAQRLCHVFTDLLHSTVSNTRVVVSTVSGAMEVYAVKYGKQPEAASSSSSANVAAASAASAASAVSASSLAAAPSAMQPCFVLLDTMRAGVSRRLVPTVGSLATLGDGRVVTAEGVRVCFAHGSCVGLGGAVL
jgi:hypothetical protein